jgi:GDP-L-fucose synthase
MAVFLMLDYDEAEIVNFGAGEDIAIRDLAEMMTRIVGHDGRLTALGWKARIGLEEGMASTYRWYRKNVTGGLVPQSR